MEKFKFKGDWWDSIIELRTFDNELNNKKYSFRRTELNKAEYLLTIADVYDENPDLSLAQKNTIEHIQNDANQIAILNNLFNYLKDVVYPEYQEYILEEEYPGTFPPLNTQEDLMKTIGLDHLSVLRFGKGGYCYYNLMFETSLDQEHGIGFVLYKNEIIEHADIGGLGYEKVAKHMEMEYEDYLKFQNTIQTPPTKELQIASNTFGKLKPWQQDVNNNYHFYLYNTNRDDKLIEYIETDKITVDKAFLNLRFHISRDKRKNLIEYFRSKGYK